jgi:hypothetical protein
MKTKILLLFLTFLIKPQCAYNQNLPLAKTIDTTHNSVVAILRVDSTGKSFVFASGILIHPNVVLTAGHVNQEVGNYWKGGCMSTGFVSINKNANSPNDRIPFNWSSDKEAHPYYSKFVISNSDTIQVTPDMEIDIGLIFLNNPIYNRPLASLPNPSTLSSIKQSNSLVGVGYGYFLSWDSTCLPEFIDGKRRQWILSNFSLINDGWLRTECDSATNLPFISMCDSGAPLLFDDKVVGIWVTGGEAAKPCPYASIAVRVDNPKALIWIKDRIKQRLGVDLK